MLKHHSTFFRRLMMAFDLGLVALAFFPAFYVRDQVDSLNHISFYLWIIPVQQVIWGGLLYYFGIYESFRIKSISEIINALGKAGAMGLILFGSLTYLFKLVRISRSLMILSFGLSVMFLSLEKIIIVLFFRHLRRKGYNFRHVLVIGSGRRAKNFIRKIEAHPEFGLKILGVIDEDPLQVGQIVEGHKIIGDFHDIFGILRESTVDHAIFIVPRSSLGKIEEAILYCETIGIPCSVAVDLFDLQFTTGREGSLFNIPVITFEPNPDFRIGSLFTKRLLDLLLSTVGLVLIAPLYLAIVIAMKLSSPGPVYFIQERCGLHGRRFKLYKFRTMEIDAEGKLKELLPLNEMQGPCFKLENDPRVTKIGKFLRKYSLDELPQLWNVWHGDMSLVGPRPPLPTEVQQYDHWQRRRLSMRPGITCIWQAKGRNRIRDFNQWSKMDLEYIDHWSLALDFKILFETIPAVLTGAGAK